MIKFFLIRHAQSEGNMRSEYISGQSVHHNLSEKGITQAKLLGKRFKKRGLGQHYEICVSPAVRTMQTATYFCNEIGLDTKILQATPEVLELSQGDWTGQLRTAVYTQEVLDLIKFDAWHFAAPNGESQSDVGHRFYKFLHSKIQKYQHVQETIHVYVFTHAVAIKCIIKELFGIDAQHTFRIGVENTSITILEYTPQKFFSLNKVNDVAHLEMADLLD